MIPPLPYGIRISFRDAIAPDFHRWLFLIWRALRGPFIGQQAPGTFIVFTGEYGIHGKRLTLEDSDRATILGTGRLVICG